MLLMNLLAPAFAGLLAAGGPEGTVHETLVHRLHRKGVHCMDVLERPKCAIKNFEAVLDERTTERELVTDSLLRLVKLHRKDGDSDEIRGLLRRFWDVGMKRRQAGHVPFSARFFPAELDLMFTVDIERVVAAPVLATAGDELTQFVFTCDAELQNNIRMTRRWQRAEQRAAAQGRATHEVLYEDMDAARERREARAARSEASRKRSTPGRVEPIFAPTLCKVAEALGQDDLRAWKKIGGAMNHKDFARSMAVIEVPDLARRLEAARRSGRLVPYADNHFVLPGVTYAKQDVHVAKLDRDELVIGRADMIGPVIAARGKRRRRMNRDVDKLLGQVPKDSAFFLVLSKAALEGLSLGHMKASSAKFLQALLPKPKGLQVAVVFHDYVGMFTRVPTDNPVKGKMLINIAQMMIDGRSEKDPEAEAWLRNLDLAQARDKRALLMTYVMSQTQIEDMMWN